MTGNTLSLVAVAGHPRLGSRTYSVTELAAAMLYDALQEAGLPVIPPLLIDLAELAPLLLDPQPGSRADIALAACQDADLLLVASPTFRGSYSGLAKLFLDLFPRHALEDTVAVPLMTAGIPSHCGAVDTMLRPVLTELSACVPGPGISVMESDLNRVEEIIGAWIGQNAQRLAVALSGRTAPRAGQAAATC